MKSWAYLTGKVSWWAVEPADGGDRGQQAHQQGKKEAAGHPRATIHAGAPVGFIKQVFTLDTNGRTVRFYLQ